MTQWVTLTTVRSPKNTLNNSLSELIIQKHHGEILLAKFTKIVFIGFSATLNFRKFKVALNHVYRIFVNFAKSCVLSCLSKSDDLKIFHRAVFEL